MCLSAVHWQPGGGPPQQPHGNSGCNEENPGKTLQAVGFSVVLFVFWFFFPDMKVSAVGG